MSAHKNYKITGSDFSLELGKKPTMMGILNITPDSFFDGGKYENIDQSVEQAKSMVAQGAKIIDIGGESTRPSSTKTPMQVELDRVIPILEKLSEENLDTLYSIDSYKALIADQAIQSGAHIINDVRGLQAEAEMADVAALHNVPIIIMHWDKKRDNSKDIIDEMRRFFEKSLLIAKDAGIANDKIVLDPGFGFAKSLGENYEILRRFDELKQFKFPLVCGTSNKSMIGNLLDIPTKERLAGTIATNLLAYTKGAHIFRVHEVKENLQALRIANATLYDSPKAWS
jgi:dihydropteroate synthase